MIMKQESNAFNPIAIVLETREDVEVFWDMIRQIRNCTDGARYEMAVEISNWLSNEAHL